MNSIKSMVKMEDEVHVIASIYAYKTYSIIHNPNSTFMPNNLMYIHRVEEALCALDGHQQELIKNDFIDRHSPNWWKPLYTCEHYLKLRYKAVSSFLKHFYE